MTAMLRCGHIFTLAINIRAPTKADS